ncbi:MAG TPA: transglutaminase family protein [Luteibacter sp.]|uniref:transglutaminase family protein n=1 Tax=Luteibacter sp. TaxID=1886636 RepID=UPI002BB4A217|nr:transglutaminase family protein [Luteibacter sp.]HVI54999.1 transglutaminase family protein [Luteibacter sp.]
MIGIWLASLACQTTAAYSAAPPSATVLQAETPLATIDRILLMADQGRDIAAIKVAVDKFIDPRINEASVLRQINEMAERIRTKIPHGADAMERTALILKYLSEDSEWNQHQTFSYDLDDPFGTKLENKLLSTYLRTRRGNCVSMPILLLALGQKLGLEMTLATAPSHVFVKVRHNGTWKNVEATSFGVMTDESYRTKTHISDLAIANQIYLRPLSRRESSVVVAEAILEKLKTTGSQQTRLDVADKLLSYDPKSVQTMLHKGNAYFHMLKNEFLDHGPSSTPLSTQSMLRYRHLQRENRRWFSRAESLGWREPRTDDDQRYLEDIRRKRGSLEENG